MEFARMMLADGHEGASRVERAAVQTAAPLLLALIFDAIVPPHTDRRAGIVRSQREAWGLWMRMRARRSDARRALRHDSVSRISRHLASLRIRNPRTRRLWTALDLLSSSGSARAC